MTRHKKDNEEFLADGVLNEEAMFAFLNNELTSEEKQKFETLLQADPFAQEALEGLQEAKNTVAVTATVATLNKKVRERSGMKERGTIQIHWSVFAYAAGLVGLLIGIGFVLVNYLGNNNQQVAMKEESKQEQVLFEQKKEPTNLISAEEKTVNDSLVVLSAKDNSVATENTPAKSPTTSIEAKKEAAMISSTSSNQGAGNSTPTTVNSSLTATSNISPVPVANAIAADKKASLVKEKTAYQSPEDKQTPAKNSASKKQITEQGPSPAMQRVERGSVVEREPADKPNTVVTIDDAMGSFNSGGYKKASQQFEDVLRNQPKNADALYFGGISDYINGDLKKSEKSFDKLLKEGSKFVDGSKWYKANILLQKGKKDEAKKLLDELSESGGSYKERALKKKADSGL